MGLSRRDACPDRLLDLRAVRSPADDSFGWHVDGAQVVLRHVAPCGVVPSDRLALRAGGVDHDEDIRARLCVGTDRVRELQYCGDGDENVAHRRGRGGIRTSETHFAPRF